ncbi:WD repeat domain-containing protein 83 [Anopheles gambiae]|uniref:WD repeat domain-containing protein 83 n=2 Tax=gambiae species complex TaxID=44542 RepID=A0A6E8VW37_ANOCL|nr:WD repeat domain-containing protein 83 [Anopheles coluzzii]XP_317330.4 WD repeat domain-containing protein 83 [Anopheles gambiae]
MDLVAKRSINCEQGAVRAVRYNVDGSYCLSCGSDKKIKLWNPRTGLLLKTYGGHADEVMDAAGSCESSYIVSASLDKSVIYWDVSTGLPVRRLRGHAGGVTCIRFNEESSIAVSGSKDNTVACWDIRTRKLDAVQTMREAKDCITALVVSEHKIISSSLDGSIRQYDIRAGELVCDTIGVPITYLVQTRDGQCLLAACSDGTIRLIDNDSGELLAEYKGHRVDDYTIECGIIAADTKIISGSAEGAAIVWDLLEGKEVRRLRIGSEVVHSLAPHPTGSDILFARKRHLEVWGKPEEDEEEVIE